MKLKAVSTEQNCPRRPLDELFWHIHNVPLIIPRQKIDKNSPVTCSIKCIWCRQFHSERLLKTFIHIHALKWWCEVYLQEKPISAPKTIAHPSRWNFPHSQQKRISPRRVGHRFIATKAFGDTWMTMKVMSLPFLLHSTFCNSTRLTSLLWKHSRTFSANG